MADVKEVETTIGKDNPFPLRLEIFEDLMEVFPPLDLFFHLHHPSEYSKTTRFNFWSQPPPQLKLDNDGEFL
jgi:hypothetical protein